MENKSYALRSNALGGESLYIHPGADLRTLPSPFLELLTHKHVAIYYHPQEYFAWLARRSRLAGMKDWFSAMAAANQCGLHLHRAEMGPSIQTDVIVRGFLRNPKSYSDFRLSSDMPVFNLPTALQDVYEFIDGTIEGDAFEACGFHSLSMLRFDSSSLPISDSNPNVDLDRAFWLYTTSNGDQLVADGDKAFYFLHEDCNFVEAGNLTAVVDSYFASLLSGAKWIPSPYRSSE